MSPQFDLSGLLTAVLSAGVLICAVIGVARSRRATTLETPLTAALLDEPPPSTSELFSTVVVERRFPGLGFALSVILHAVVIFGTPMLPYLFPQELQVDFRRYRLRIVDFRVPQRLLSPVPADRPAPPSARTAAGAAARLRALAASRPKFQLPASPRRQHRDTIIQPDQPPDLHAAVPQPLPRTFLWAQAPAPVEESRLVGAFSLLLPREFSLPNARPDLRTPNRELAIGDLPIAAAPVLTFRPPQLPVPAANVSPLGIPDAASPGELPATALPAGSPMNLIALLQQLASPASSYLLGIGNRLPDSAAEAAGGATAATAAVRGAHADLLAAAPQPAPLEPLATPPAAAAPELSAPSRGRLGIIIVQQYGAETGLEGGELLTGQPVHTVHLDVPGSPHRWTLQYCVPGSETGLGLDQSTEERVRILPRQAIQPPRPIDRVPVDTAEAAGTVRRLVLFAVVNEQGEVRDARVVRGSGRPVDQVALAALERWTFQPATRSETPVAVEALFGIPVE